VKILQSRNTSLASPRKASSIHSVVGINTASPMLLDLTPV
jgi:hypothetical protein